MKIVTGASSLKTVLERINAGVDEIFCGYLPTDWVDQYKYIVSPNRRWGKLSNFTSIQELERAVNVAHNSNVSISITLNAHNYNNKQWMLLKKMIDELVDIEVDSFIVVDIAILIYIKENYPEISVHISTGGTVFNSDAVEFYQKLGADRIIFPRSLKPEEVISISKIHSSMEFEVFMSSARCANIDGFCFFEHAIMYTANGKNEIDNYPMCSVNYEVDTLSKGAIINKNYISNNFKKKKAFNVHSKACGACYLYDFYEENINYFKIPARASAGKNDRQKALKEIRFIKEMIKSVKKINNRKDYKEFTINNFKKYFNIKCTSKGINCYY